MFWSSVYHGHNTSIIAIKSLTALNSPISSLTSLNINLLLDFLGDTLSLNMIQPRQQKVYALLNFPPPKTRKQVKSLLGLAGYYRRFLPHYSDLAYLLTALLKKTPRLDRLKQPTTPSLICNPDLLHDRFSNPQTIQKSF